MKTPIPLLFIIVPLALAVPACGQISTTAPEPPHTDLPTQAPGQSESPAPTHTPPPTVTPPPTDTLMPQVGDTWTRPADDMLMVYVPAGEFQMGSTDAQVDEAFALCNLVGTCPREVFEDEQPAHAVALDGLWVDRTEVTNAQYRRCVEAGKCEAPEFHNYKYKDAATENHPMVYVDWFEAQAYCEWAGARLPTEAEWEHAARGPEGRVFPWGDHFDDTRLNYCDANCTESHADDAADDGHKETAPVGSYPNGASWCGTLDMTGNVSEWVADRFDEYPSERQENPTGPASGETRIVRGGWWKSRPVSVRGASRS